MHNRNAIGSAKSVRSILTTWRLLRGVLATVCANHGLTFEEAEILLALSGRSVSNWNGQEQDAEGYVSLVQLSNVCASQSLLSRRLEHLAGLNPPLVSVASANPYSGAHFNSKRARITTAGRERIEPVWELYQKVALNLVSDLPLADLEVHSGVNKAISQRIRDKTNGIENLFR